MGGREEALPAPVTKTEKRWPHTLVKSFTYRVIAQQRKQKNHRDSLQLNFVNDLLVCLFKMKEKL